MKKKVTPINYVPDDSYLVFINQTVFGWRKRSTNERVTSKGLYKCICGNIKEYAIAEVKRGKVKSCGCLKFKKQKEGVTKHGLWNTPLYNIWIGIKNRCYKKDNQAYKWYGARGVKMCDEWLNDVSAFCKWCMDNGWKPGLQVDKDVKGDGLLYSPETCSLVTCKQNNNKRGSCRFLTYNGVSKTMSEWADSCGLNYATFESRISAGWTIEKAINKPIRKCKK